VLGALLPSLRDDSWFFDTELLLVAEHNGLRIHEVPVDWIEDVDTRVNVRSTVLDDLRGLYRVARSKADGTARVAGLPRRREVGPTHPDAVLARPGAADALGAGRGTGWQLLCFAFIGVVSTVATVGLYALLREVMPPLAANLFALVATTLLNTEANRRLTFLGARGSTGRVHAQGLLVFALYYGLTSSVLLLLGALVPNAGRMLEIAVLVAASALGTAGRFAMLRTWVFGGSRRPRE
jgi:putative flippase GtrA